MKAFVMLLVAALALCLLPSLAEAQYYGDCHSRSYASGYAVQSYSYPTYSAPLYSVPSATTHCSPDGCVTTFSAPAYVRRRVLVGYTFDGFPVYRTRLVRVGY